jgi:Predicted transmembrane transcriptional regulator (anti-sigma factor)
MIRETQITDREWLLLSAYLDEQLSEKEKRQVEDLLQAKPASRIALEGLKRTRRVLQFLPVRKVPRNFTLGADQVRKPFLPSFSRVLSYSSALAALLLVVVLGLDLFSGAGSPGASRIAAANLREPTALTAADESAKLTAEKSPAIIYWNGVNSPVMGAYGKGGGGEGIGGGGYAYGMGGGGAEGMDTAAAPLMESAPAAKQAESDAAAEMALPAEEPAPALEMAPEAGQLESQPQPQEESGAYGQNIGGSFVLGVRPAEERGSIFTRTGDYTVAYPEKGFSWLPVEIGLGLAALAAGLTAFLLRKR